MSKFMTRFWHDERGVTAIEYGLIASLVAVAIIVVVGDLGNSLNTTFSKINTALGGAGAGNP